MRYTINQIQDEMTRDGSHWWDRDSMRFFQCRVGDQVYQGPGGIYFVTSEKPSDGKRAFSVRQYFPASKSIDTVGEFCSMSRSVAHRVASDMAATPLDEQFTEAMARLDMAVTGSCRRSSTHVTCYGTHAAAVSKGEGLPDPIYLSDGGYTRVLPRRYEDSNGFYLKLIPTQGSEERQEKVRAKFSDSYKLQCEVCRVLATEPAGDEATVSAEIHKMPTASEQLAMDISRGGGNGVAASAGVLIRLATKHHKMMEDYCNGISIYDEEDEPLPALANLRKSIEDVAKQHGCKGVIFSGDPRGCTVKLILPDGSTNDWGKEGWCIPTRD